MEKENNCNTITNIYELEQANLISEKMLRKAKHKNFVDKDGNIKEDYAILFDENNQKVVNFVRVDDKDYIKAVSKSVEEKMKKMLEELCSIDNLLFSNSSKLSYKVDAIVCEKLMDFNKILVDSNNNMEYFLHEKHGDKFIQEVKNIVQDKTYRLLKENLPNKKLEEILIINQNYFAEILKFKLDEVVAKIKLSSSEEIINDNILCILQLAIYKGLVNKTINEIIEKMDKFTSRKEIIDSINPMLEEFDYELLK